ncbi:TPA: hypothetical protein HNO21_11235 [Escherichia coli]|nr:hypothetical protein [Escherichia coli]HAJ7186996.1 hypothetical protein [Escherichia coli]
MIVFVQVIIILISIITSIFYHPLREKEIHLFTLRSYLMFFDYKTGENCIQRRMQLRWWGYL